MQSGEQLLCELHSLQALSLADYEMQALLLSDLAAGMVRGAGGWQHSKRVIMVLTSSMIPLHTSPSTAPQQCVTDAGPDGIPAIQHGSRVKVRLQHPGGWMLDRIPAWAKWATVAPGEMGAKFNGIYWDPPPQKRHQWCTS